MTQAIGSSWLKGFQRAALCGLLAVTCHLTGGAREAAANDGYAVISSPAGDCEPAGVYAMHDPYLLNADHSFGSGRGRIPFDRWYYLRRALGYHRIYPADVRYSDPRDGRVYSAWGYGVPMAVPLASNVVYQYNYSTGPQASRLTPVARPLP